MDINYNLFLLGQWCRTWKFSQFEVASLLHVTSFSFLLNGVRTIRAMLQGFARNITYISLSRLQTIDPRLRTRKW